jgi:hypothetical protein
MYNLTTLSSFIEKVKTENVLNQWWKNYHIWKSKGPNLW